MKRQIAIITLAALCPMLAFGRGVQMLDMPTLISKSTLVFVGRVKKVEPSGIKTTMSYPTWKGVTFEWLNCNVEVIELVKGVKKSELIRTAMLSAPGGGPHANPPGMVDPEEGSAYLFCLAPATLSNTFAAVTAPWDDNEAIFVLDRSFWLYQNYRKDEKETFPLLKERYGVLWSLVDDKGALLPVGAAQMRQTYAKEIASAPPTNLVIHLEWQTVKSASGWQWDAPKGQGNATNSADKETSPGGPITFPSNESK